MYFCVKCGKKVKSGVFCSEHGGEKVVIKTVNVKVCECGRCHSSGRWTNATSTESFIKKVLKKLHESAPAKLVGEKKNIVIYEAGNHKVFVNSEKCDLCQRQHSKYFEGVLQLRFKPMHKDTVEKIIEKQESTWAKKYVYITRREDITDGIDLWLTSKKEIGLFADKINRRFGATVIKSPKLFSRNKQTQKNIYRLNVLVKFPEFTEGDVVFVNKKLTKVTQLRRQIKGIDLTTGKSFGFFLKNEPLLLEKKSLVVSKTKPELTVLSDEDYEERPIFNKRVSDQYTVDKEVNVVVYEGRYYFIPPNFAD